MRYSEPREEKRIDRITNNMVFPWNIVTWLLDLVTPKETAMSDYHPFIYHNVTVTRIIDGDTIEIEIDLGFKIKFRDNFRLADISTPRRGEAGFDEASAYTTKWLEDNKDIGLALVTTDRDKYGRWLAVLISHETESALNDELLNEGHAVAYNG